MRSISDIAPSKYRADIDGLRALAVASVIAFHAFPTVFPGGLIGVDVFFVISGFLITGIILDGLQKDAFSFAEFYRRRIRRIFPSLIVVLAASMIAGWFLLLPDEFTRLGKHVVASAAFIQNFILWGESGYFDKAAATKPLLHLWSLGVEEQFYIVWPLLLLAAGRLRLSKSWLVGSILAISFIVSLIYARQDSTLAFYSPVTRFWELMTGGMLAVVAGQNRYGKASSGARNLGGNIKSIVGLVAIALPICVLDDKSLFPGWWALLPTVGCYLVLSAGPEAWCNRIVLSWRPLVWLGLISYPLYLWHWPLLSFMTIAESRIPSVEARIGAVLISVALAWATYRFVNRRFDLALAERSRHTVLVSQWLWLLF